MSAEVYRSKAQIPRVSVIYGFQSGCDDDECATDERGIALGVGEDMRLVRWWGPFQENWIDARADTVEHNLTAHPTRIPTWEEIIHGRHDADELSALRTH